MKIGCQNHYGQCPKRRRFYTNHGLLLFFSSLMLIILGCGDTKQATSQKQSIDTTALTANSTELRSNSKPAATETNFSIDPCALITEADAESITAEPVNPPLQETLEDPAGKSCRYFTQQSAAQSRAVEISVWESNNLKQGLYGWPADEHFERFKNGHKNSGKNFEPLHGLGDDAYYWGSYVYALKGPYVLMVSARGYGSGGADTDAKNKEATIRAATLAINKVH